KQTAEPAAANAGASTPPSSMTGSAANAADGVSLADPQAAEREPTATSTASADRASPLAADLPVVDEAIYFPGARTRPKGSAVEASLDDEIVATWNHGGLSREPTNGTKG